MNYDLKDNKIEYACFVLGDWIHSKMIIWEVKFTDGSSCYELLKWIDDEVISIRCATLKEVIEWVYELLPY
jgi:hypothetical protein